MAILDMHQLKIIAKLREGRCSKSELTSLMDGGGKEEDLFLMKQLETTLETIKAAGIPLNIRSNWVELEDRKILLDKQTIYNNLTKQSQAILASTSMKLLLTVTSTNDDIKNYPAPCALVAEQQEKGKGRYGRNWVSPFAAGIYLSLRLKSPHQDMSGLSLVVGVAIARILAPIDIKLKWPNDLMVAEQKLGGILIELAEEDLIIGVGINYNQLSGQVYLLQYHPYSRNLLVASLINQLLSATEMFFTNGFIPFRQDWQERDILMGKQVKIRNGETVTGLCEGVDDQGALLVRTYDGTRQVRSGTLQS